MQGGTEEDEYEPMMTSPDLLSSYGRNEQCGPSTGSGSICTREYWESDQLTRLSEVGQVLQDGLRDTTTPRKGDGLTSDRCFECEKCRSVIPLALTRGAGHNLRR